MSKYRIVSFDGGGIRGLLTSVILERLEEAVPGFLAHVDLYAGTSTGSALAVGLAAGRTPTEARQLYEALGSRIFARRLRNRVRYLDNAVWARYSNQGLKQALTEQFGDATLGDLPKKILVTCFDLDNYPTDPGRIRTWKPKFFNNFQEPDKQERVVDVIMRSGAAPAYMPSYQGYVDGGVVANNPSMAALAQAIDEETGGQALEDVVLLSFGTGLVPKYVPHADIGNAPGPLG